MNSSESASAVLGLFLLLQLAGFMALLLGGFYLLNCLARIVSSLERLAEAAEERLVRSNYAAPSPNIAPQSALQTTIEAPPIPVSPPVVSPPRDFPVVSGSDQRAPASSTRESGTVSHEEAPR